MARRARGSRVTRDQLATIKTRSTVNSRPGSSHRECSTARSGNTTCSTIATTIAMITGQRLSRQVRSGKAVPASARRGLSGIPGETGSSRELGRLVTTGLRPSRDAVTITNSTQYDSLGNRWLAIGRPPHRMKHRDVSDLCPRWENASPSLGNCPDSQNKSCWSGRDGQSATSAGPPPRTTRQTPG
jgi:hypothetical protein